jgi:hypothetical protein
VLDDVIDANVVQIGGMTAGTPAADEEVKDEAKVPFFHQSNNPHRQNKSISR